MPESSLAGPSTPPPDSPSRNSLYVATANVEDLARSLHGFSRASTPEPVDGVDPEYTRAWLAVKSKLESRLVLSAGAQYSWYYPALKPDGSLEQRLGRHCYNGMKRMYAKCRSVYPISLL